MKPEWLMDCPMPTSDDGEWQLSDLLESVTPDELTQRLQAEAEEAGFDDVEVYLANP